MLDQILEWAVIVLPFLFAIGVEVIDEDLRKRSRAWRIGVVAFGLFISALTWLQISHARKRATEDQEKAVLATSEKVSSTVSEAVSKSVSKSLSDQYSQTIDTLQGKIGTLQAQLATKVLSATGSLQQATARIEQDEAATATQIEKINQELAVVREGNPSAAALVGYTKDLAQNLRDFPRSWQYELNTIEYFKGEFQMTQASRFSKKDVADALATFDERRKNTIAEKKHEFASFLDEASSLVEKMLERIPKERQTAEDKGKLQEIATLRAQIWSWSYPTTDMNPLANYMDSLAQRLATAQ